MEAISLKLYITDHNKRSVAAIENLTRILESYNLGSYELEIIDVLKDAERALRDRIMATPTLVRLHSNTVMKIIGDLSETDKVISALKING